MRVRNLTPGTIVIIRHNGLEKIKRISEVLQGGVVVLGDNPSHSTDSRSFGTVPYSAIVAKVLIPKQSAKIERR